MVCYLNNLEMEAIYQIERFACVALFYLSGST